MTSVATERRAVVLLSGGLDSATVLAEVVDQGYAAYALSVAYGQRHSAELAASEAIAAHFKAAAHQVLTVDVGRFGGSALTDQRIAVPEDASDGIPVTYVPARNTLFLSLALGWAEVLDAEAIFIGVNAVDYSGYPDCRPAFIDAFSALAAVATKSGVEGHGPRIEAPLMTLGKADIIARGTALGVPWSLTVSCYQADSRGRACGRCDSCRLRREGFAAAGLADPTRYQPGSPHHGNTDR
ncbi:7-cyano-7-deazaguanine synthase QueC [Polycyclovorans algicola]|uniref:7-cyano-7-deazaguanine synthase QueC n=1 Tax=Polycyclovorans algicola TaxID=616992 RepID=UPI0012678B7E